MSESKELLKALGLPRPMFDAENPLHKASKPAAADVSKPRIAMSSSMMPRPVPGRLVRIIQPGREAFTGVYGLIRFVDGVSVKPVNAVEINRVASSIRLADAATGEEVGPFARMRLHVRSTMTIRLDTTHPLSGLQAVAPEAVEAEPEAALEAEAPIDAEFSLEDPAPAEAPPEAAPETPPETPPVPAPSSIDMSSDEGKIRLYTQAELETVAETAGIVGLREIGKPLGVTAKSILEMIAIILRAQAKLSVNRIKA